MWLFLQCWWAGHSSGGWLGQIGPYFIAWGKALWTLRNSSDQPVGQKVVREAPGVLISQSRHWSCLGEFGEHLPAPSETLLGSYPEILILENQMISFFFFSLCEPYGSNKNMFLGDLCRGVFVVPAGTTKWWYLRTPYLSGFVKSSNGHMVHLVWTTVIHLVESLQSQGHQLQVLRHSLGPVVTVQRVVYSLSPSWTITRHLSWDA